MKEYINVALDRLNNKNNNKNNILIPIMVCDKQNRNYGIEWVLIINIIHRQCHVGISFNYNISKNLFQAKAVYLDKSEIVSKHKLIGLKYDYCNNLRDFSVKKLRFKGNSTIINDDNENDMEYKINDNHNNDDVVLNAKKEIKQYQNAIQSLNTQNRALQQQLTQQQQTIQQFDYAQQINYYRQQQYQQQINYEQQQQQQQQLAQLRQQQQNYLQQQQQQQQQQYQQYNNNNEYSNNNICNSFTF